MPSSVIDHELIARYRTARRDPALAVLEGLHSVKHARRFAAEIIDCRSDRPDALHALAADLAPDLAEFLAHRLKSVSPDTFAQLAPSPHETGLIALANRPTSTAPATGPAILLENPSHLGNIGAAIRVAAGLDATALLVTGDTDPWHPTALRGAAGLHFALHVERTTLAAITATSRPIIALDPEGEPLERLRLPEKPILAFGSERQGLTDTLLQRADMRVSITMREGVSSLNLATSVAIVLHCWRRNRG